MLPVIGRRVGRADRPIEITAPTAPGREDLYGILLDERLVLQHSVAQGTDARLGLAGGELLGAEQVVTAESALAVSGDLQ